jgi:lipoprotein-anchoring transpeptidase ErfK/SrfK
MREKIFTPLLAFICSVALGACAMRQGDIGAATSATPSAPTPQPTSTASVSPSVTPTPGGASANYTPVTLPVLDAFFVDEGFTADLKNRVGLKDEEIARLRKAAREETSALSETDDGEGRAQSAERRADEKIKAVVGKEKAEQLYALVRERWGGAGEAGANVLPPIEENAVPTDTRVVVNAPAYRMDVFENGRLIKSYRVGIGYPEFPLPTGLRRAKQIIFNPTWTPPDEPWVEGSNKVKPGEKVPAGSKLNPLGAAKIPIGLPSLIHGGKAAEKIGGFASHGCVGLTDEQLIEFTKLLARIGGTELTDAQIAEFRRNPTETKTVELPNPVPVELRYETIVVDGGRLKVYRDVYGRGTNTEEHLRRVLEAHGAKLEELSEAERMQAMDALDRMGRDAKGREVSVDSSTLAGSPSPSPSPAKKAASGRVTRQIKGEKEVTLTVAALQGEQGYPAPVALNAGAKTPAPPARSRKKL